MSSPFRARALALFVLPFATACGEDDSSVVIDTRDHFGASEGRSVPSVTVPENPYASIRLLVGGDPEKVVEGTWREGVISFGGVSRRNNVVEYRTRHDANFPGDNDYLFRAEYRGRSIRTGNEVWARERTERVIDAPLSILFDATGFAPIPDYGAESYFGFYSQSGDMLREMYLPDFLEEVLDEDVTQLQDVAIDLQLTEQQDYRPGVPLIDTAAGDDFTITQSSYVTNVESVDGPFETFAQPWGQSTFEFVTHSAEVASAKFSAEVASKVVATFSPVETSAVVLDVRGDSFAPMRAELALPETSRATMVLQALREPGVGPNFFNGGSPINWTLRSRASQPIPVDPLCYSPRPANVPCDPGCTTVCNSDSSGYADPGDVRFAFDIPHAFRTLGTDTLEVRYYYSMTTSAPLPRTIYVYTRSFGAIASNGTIVVERLLGGPTALTVDGQAMPWVPTEDATTLPVVHTATPTVSWGAPTFGDPVRYTVTVIELDPEAGIDGTERTTRTVAFLHTFGTSMTIPENVLRDGHHYTITVTAVQSGYALEDTRIAPRDAPDLRSENVTNPFRVDL